MLLKLKNTQVAGNGAFILKWPQEADWLVTNKSRGEGERKTILSGIEEPESPGGTDFKTVSCSLCINENKTKRDLPPYTLFN